MPTETTVYKPVIRENKLIIQHTRQVDFLEQQPIDSGASYKQRAILAMPGKRITYPVVLRHYVRPDEILSEEAIEERHQSAAIHLHVAMELRQQGIPTPSVLRYYVDQNNYPVLVVSDISCGDKYKVWSPSHDGSSSLSEFHLNNIDIDTINQQLLMITAKATSLRKVIQFGAYVITNNPSWGETPQIVVVDVNDGIFDLSTASQFSDEYIRISNSFHHQSVINSISKNI